MQRQLALLYITLLCVFLCLLVNTVTDHEIDGTGILLFLTAVVLVFSVLFYVLRLKENHQHLEALCRQFCEGTVYQDFVNEIGGLFPGLGEAVSHMDSLIDRQNIMQLSTKQAEFLALQNQINPHFLYNTLESIRGDALAAGVSSIADITEALSTFFRYTITETRNLVTLGEELENVENYFVIQQYRFGDKLRMKTEIVDDPEAVLALQCPKLFLQPLIENAIFHGLERRSENGLITIRIEFVDHNVHIDISDNGAGIEEEQLNALNQRLNRVSVGAIIENNAGKKGGIALRNVCRRIKLLFGEQYGLHVSSIVGIGTKVEVILPVTYKSTAHEK